MKTFTLIILTAFFAANVSAQSKFELAAKYGFKTKSISALFKLPNNGAIEGIFSMNHDKNKVVVTGLYEEFYAIGSSERLYWFLGAGLHAGYTKVITQEKFAELKYGEVLETKTRDVVTKQYLTGADMIAGISYYIPRLKMVVGVDTKPSIDFLNSYSILFDGNLRIGIAL